MSKAYAEAYAKKKKKNQKTVATKKPQSSSVSKADRINQKNYGTTQPKVTQKQPTPRARTATQQRSVDPKEARRQESARAMRSAARRFASEDRRTAAQAQRMNMPTAEEQRKARQTTKAVGKAISNSVKESMTEESRARMQRQKSGIQTEEDKRYNEQRNQRRIEVAKNTGRAAKKGVQDTLTGYGKTLADIDEMAKSSDKWTEAKSMKLGIDKDDTAGRAKVEEERQKSIKEARRLRLALGEKQEKRQKEFDEATKNATGLEKAWYGAVESGTGMATDMAVGAVTGTGQVGALASMGIRSYGATRGQAEKEGATENEDRLYSLLQAGKEVGTEMMFQGAGLAKSAFSGGKVGLSLADRAANSFTRNMTGRAADATAAGIRLLGGTAEENAEEFAGWLADPVIKELTYGRNVRQREAKAALKQESDAIRANITSEEDARSAAAYLNSDRFIEDYTQQYKDAGLNDKQAREAAEQMREYLTASLSGDIDRMAELEDSIATTMGGKLRDSANAIFGGFDKGELMDTFASTTLLTLTTGLPAGVSTAVRGSVIRDNLGTEGLRALSETAINFEDGVASIKGQAARDRIDEGKELTSTQVYDLAQAQAQQIEKDNKRAQAAGGVADAKIRDENYVTPQLRFGRNGSVSGDEVIAANYVKESNEATDIIEDLLDQEGAESLTDTEVQNGSRAIAGFKTGAFTIADANALNYTNTTVRSAFKEATGVDLDQYVLRDSKGNVDIPKTNAATKDALFAMAADNFVKTAEAETANWMDNAKGEVVTEVTSRMGAQGSVALQAALDDVDERDRSTYMLQANAADMMYQTARNMGTEWDTVKAEAKSMFPGVSEDTLRDMYNAGLRDREAASTRALGKQVKIGETMDLSGEAESPKGNVFIDTEYSPKGSVVRVFSEIATNLGVDIHLVDDLKTGTGTQANGQYINGAIYINVRSNFEKNVGYIFMHEVTHHLKLYAPEQFNALENLARERWFDANAGEMENEIAKKIDLYKKNGQTLSEEEALEEIIADAAHEFINDSNFARQAAETDPSLAKVVLDSIRNALRAIRRILAFSNLDDETHMNTLFSQLGILDEAERLWLDAYTQAVKNRAAVGLVQWDEDARNSVATTNDESEARHSISAKDSEGNTLSEGQREFFKDSKAVDENGNLIYFYHGTPDFGFTVFDESGFRDHDGWFFTDRKDAAESYEYGEEAGTYAVYLNLTNPMIIDAEGQDWTDIQTYTSLEARDRAKEIDARLDEIRDAWRAGTDEGEYERLLDELDELDSETSGGDTDSWVALAKENGHDGLIIRNIIDYGANYEGEDYEPFTEAIAFEQKQIKNVDNLDPTQDPDIRYSVSEMPSMEQLDQTNALVEDNNGDAVAQFDEDGSVSFSISSYEDEGREVYRDYLDKLVKDGELSQKEADQMAGELETIYRISKRFADQKDSEGNPVYAPYTTWSYANVVRDEKGRPVFSAIKKNSEYKMNIDFSTICKKRRTLDAVFREMIKRGLFEQLDLNKDESAALVVNINNLIRKNQFEAACALCFVEARRYRQQQTAKTFTDMWNGLVESMYEDKSKIGYFNFGRDEQVTEVPDGIHTMDDSQLDLSHIRKIANEKKDGKLKQTAEAKAARLILNDPNQRKLMRVGDMMASTGFENMQIENPELMKVYNSKKGTGGAKSSFGDVQYLNEMLKSRTFDRMKAYDVSGVRIQSFSDYVPRMVFDYVQVIADLAAKKLPAHAYTKEPLFVKQFGLTGVKINLSLVPDVVADGVAPGLDANGNYIWNEEGTFPYDEAMRLQEAEGYKENCGTIAVGISDEQIMMMLADPTIQMVIPYHKSSLNPIVAAMTNVDRFTNYEDFQNTKNAEGKAVKTDFAWDKKLFALTHYTRGEKKGELKPKDKWGNVQDLVKDYVKWCEDRKYTPKFSQFLYLKENNDPEGAFVLDDNGNKIINPGYYKMLEDFALLDNDLNFKPQGDVQMKFPTKESAFGSMEDLIKQGLSEDTQLEADRSAKIGGIVNEIENMMKEGTLTEQSATSEKLAAKFSISPEMDEEYMDAVNSGNMEEAQRLVDEAAKMAGFNTPLLHHGTPSFGFTTFDLARGENIIFATNSRLTAETYSGETSRNRISEKSKVDIDQLYGQGLLDKAKQHLSRYKDYRLMSGSEKEDLLDEARSDMASIANDVVGGFIAEHRDAFDEEKLGIANRIVDSLNKISTAWNDDDVQTAWDDFQDAIWDLKWADESIQLELSREIQSGGALQFLKNRISDFMYAGDLYARGDSTSEYVYDNQLALELGAELNKGIYGLYGNPGKQLVIDANGSNWNQIIPPDELGLYGPQRTRSIAEAAKAKGYDSVLFKDLRDNGGATAYNGESDVYMFFNPNQVKSADPVTYAEDGSVIPLSERFDPNNNDIRYSLPTQDADGKVLTDGQMEYFKNSQARDEQGRLIPVYHGTFRGPRITVFNETPDGIWFTSDRDIAEDYSMGYEMGIPGALSGDERNPYDSDDEYFAKKGIRIEQDSNGDWVAAINRNGREHYWGAAESREELIEDLYASNENEELFDTQFTLRDVYPVYLNLENPKIIECNGSMHDDINGTGMTTRELAAEAMAEGYDGIIFRDVVDPFEPIDVYVAFSSNQIKDINNENPTENPDIRYSIPSEDEVMNFAQTESNTTDDLWYTDPVLQEGVIRYSVSKDDFINGVINKWNPAWKTEGHVLKDSSVEPAIRNVIMGAMRDSDTNVKYRQKVVKDTMLVARQAYDKMKSDNYTEAAELLYDHAHSIIENLEFFGNQDQSEFERYKNLRDYLRKTKFTVPEDKRSDIDYEAYRRRNFRKILLGSDGVAPDKEWQNLHEIWPEVFTEDIKGDIPSIMLQLENAVEVYQPYAEAYSSEQCEEFAGDIADSLYDIIYEGEAYKSLADKYDDKAKAMRERHREAMQKVKDNYKEKLNEKTLEAKRREYRKLDAQKAKLTDKYEQKLSDTKDMYERKLKTQQRKADFEIATLKQNREYNIKRLQAEKTRAVEEERRRSAYKVADNRREQRERTMHRQLYNSVLKEYKDLTHRLLNPTKEKAKNIPEQLRQPLAQMLHCFDLEKERSKKLEEMYMIPTRSQLNFRELKDALDKVTKEDPTAYEISDIHEYLKGKMTELADRVDGKTIDSLDIADLQTIKELLVGLNSAIKNGQQLEIDGENYQKQVQCDKLGEGAAEYQKLHGKAKTFSGPREWWDNIANMGELTPVYFFRQIKGLYDMYRQIRRGFDSYVRNEKMVIDKIADILAPYYKTNRKGQKVQGSEIEDWRHSESAETFDLIVGNQTITLTIAQKMSLYCLAKRDQAQKHMFAERGGVVASEITAGSKIHKAEELLKGKIVEQRRVVLTPADIQNIIATLTDEQKEIADNLQKLMTDDMAKLGNEASVKLTGIEMYKEKEYFPIKVQGDSRATNPDNIGIQEKIRNPGFSNPLQEKVSNPIIVDDIFTVVASHCNEMNQYAAYAVPITNFMKVYNGETLDVNGEAVKIKTVIRETYGDKAITYIENFINDINGNSFRRHGGLDDVLDKALGQAKKAAVFANLRVALQQPTAIIRAFAVMKVKYFKGVKPSAKETQEMFEHCPIAQWKSWGYYDTHFGRDIEDVMMGKNIPSKMDYFMSEAYGWFDNMTWGMIWQAVKNEVKESNPNVEYGSEKFWELCNERASFVFDSTQVVDSPFHRSDSMRSKNGLVKQMTSFQAEPTLSFNVLRQAFVDAFEESKKGNNTKAKQILGRMLAVWVAQAAFVALAQSMVDALRRKGHKDADDDEDDAMRWYEVLMKYFTRNYVNNFKDDVNPINNIYFIKDIVPGLLNAIKGEYVYGQQNLTFQWLDTLTNGIQMCKKKWEKGDSYSKSWYECLTELFGGFGYMAGLPAKTVMRGFGNAAYWLNKMVGIEVFAADGSVDKAVDSFIDRFRSEDAGASSGESSSSKSEKKKSKESKAEREAKIEEYREGLSDNLSDEQKDKLVKQYEKNLDNEDASEEAAEITDVKAHINEGIANFEAEMEKRSLKAAEKAGSKTGRARDEILWDVIAEGYSKSVESGNMATIWKMRETFEKNGGDVEWFDAKITDKMKSAYKKTLYSTDEIVPGAVARQQSMKDYLLEHGVSETELSDICYHSSTARDLKAALRMGNEEYILDELTPLIQAGLTYEDFEKLYKYRNNGAKTYDGKYTDEKYRQSTGNFIWPTEGVITSHFGYRNAPTAGASSNHPAIDIGAPQGTAVVAADGGTVIYAGRNSGYGNSVGIKHDNGMVTYYNHLYSWNVKVGDTVGQGQQIAQVGSTGISTGPHLDFKILDTNGEPVDPEQYLQKRQ